MVAMGHEKGVEVQQNDMLIFFFTESSVNILFELNNVSTVYINLNDSSE